MAETIMHIATVIAMLAVLVAGARFVLGPSAADRTVALRIAIQREMGAHQLYQYLASIAENQQIKELFNRLALEELKHKMRLEGMYDENFLSEN
ncbi:ferritin family protein [Caldithrix abyssi]